MGKVTRPSPARLAGKLRQIRETLGLSQNEMIRHLGLAEELHQASISGYEIGTREPPLPVLLQYARAAGVCVDVLIDDELNLPGDLPSLPDHHISARPQASRLRGERRSAR
jgi:transcriptional regulator with XRE-family HTH domain